MATRNIIVDCGVYRVLKPKEPHSEGKQQQVLKVAQERVSLRGLFFGGKYTILTAEFA